MMHNILIKSFTNNEGKAKGVVREDSPKQKHHVEIVIPNTELDQNQEIPKMVPNTNIVRYNLKRKNIA